MLVSVGHVGEEDREETRFPISPGITIYVLTAKSPEHVASLGVRTALARMSSHGRWKADQEHGNIWVHILSGALSMGRKKRSPWPQNA